MADWYCDFINGDDTTGDGSVGLPYKTLQKVLTTAGTAGVTNNIYLLASEALTAPLSFPSSNRDWNICGAMVTGVYPVISNASGAIGLNHLYVNLHRVRLEIGGASETLGLNFSVRDCVVSFTNARSLTGTSAVVFDSYLFGAMGGTNGITLSRMQNCVVDCNGSVGSSAVSCVWVVDSLIIQRQINRRAITGNGAIVSRCALVAPEGSSAAGVSIGDRGGSLSNCIVAGFAIGVDGNTAVIVDSNSFFDCATNTSNIGISFNNETLIESPFVDASGGDYAPKNIGDLRLGVPEWYSLLSTRDSRYRGAIQPAQTRRPSSPFLQQVIG